jgi:hypothetical protein
VQPNAQECGGQLVLILLFAFHIQSLGGCLPMEEGRKQLWQTNK